MNWYPTPSYLVKRQVILDYLENISCGSVLEVGCGCGDLLAVLEKRGFRGMGIDISRDALDVAAKRLKGGEFRIVCCTPDEMNERFDVVIASEVMEHHQDDVKFLQVLGSRLRDNGLLLLTVPAHMRDWGANDDFCGHVRRYSRLELMDKLQLAGFSDVVIRSYGVPVYNLMKPFYDRFIGQSVNGTTEAERTEKSGGMWLMHGWEPIFNILFNDVSMSPFYWLQRMFYSGDLGKGYFAAARKKESV